MISSPIHLQNRVFVWVLFVENIHYQILVLKVLLPWQSSNLTPVEYGIHEHNNGLLFQDRSLPLVAVVSYFGDEQYQWWEDFAR
jgi:hypothetical protein